MAITEREKVIAVLQKERKTALHDNVWAFDYAISSLKTDLKYDLMYEGEEVYTKDEVIDMFNDLKSEIEKTAEEEKNYDVKWALGLLLAKKIIQEKINVLKENK